MSKRLATISHYRRWWLRSPNPNNANNVYYVNTSGTLNNNNANNENGVSLDRILNFYFDESKPTPSAETSAICKELQTLPRIKHAVNQSRRRAQLDKPVGRSISFDVFSMPNLFRATRECALGVSWKNSVMKWKLHTAALCSNLYREIHSGTYSLSRYVTFEVYSPKRRTIRSLLFRDRVVQRVMCNEGLYDDLTRNNIYDNGACQKHRGTLFALDRFRILLGRYFRKHGNQGWVLRLDIHHFFDSIPHDQLHQMVRRRVRNPQFIPIVDAIIDSFGNRGIGLGSQISQLLAISYLSELDHKIKEQMKIKCYVRYSDDMVLVHPDRQHLEHCFEIIKQELAQLGLELNPKSCLHPLKQGISFLKFRYTLTSSGKVIYKPSREMLVRARRRMERMVSHGVSAANVCESFRSWASFALQGSGYTKVKQLKDQIERKLKCRL